MENVNSNGGNFGISAIDKALAAARARKAAKEAEVERAAIESVDGGSEDGDLRLVTTKVSAEAAAAAKAARKAQREADREAAKLRRAEERDARREAKAQRDSQKNHDNVHMKKVDKLRARLPELTGELLAVYDDAVSRFSAQELNSLAQHLLVKVREAATAGSRSAVVELGSRVEILGGEPRFIGRVGKITKVQRIRCFVELEGVRSPVYAFISDVRVVDSDEDK